jgi:hypothetical protein
MKPAMLIRNAMRQSILPLLSLLVACSAPPAEEPAVPTALQDPGAVQEIKGSLSRGGYDKDLVDALFADVLERDTALRSLMDALDDRRGAHGDSLENHRLFEQHNRAYYASALEHTAQLSDSVEREQQRALLRRSEERYAAAMAASRALDQHYDSVRVRTEELVVLIKLQRSLDLMERYQQRERPGDATLKAELQRIQALEQRLRAVWQ